MRIWRRSSLVALLALALHATSAWAALTVNMTTPHNAASGTSITSAALSAAAGDLIGATLCTQNNRTFAAGDFSDTAGDTFHIAGGVSPSGNANACWAAYAYNSAGNASNHVIATYAVGGYDSITYFNIHSSNGAFSSDPLDDNQGLNGNSASVSSGTVTVTGASDVIIAGMETDGRGTAAGSGYTLSADDGSGYNSAEYHVVTASEAATATCGFGLWTVKAAAFKEPSGGASGCAQSATLALLGVSGRCGH